MTNSWRAEDTKKLILALAEKHKITLTRLALNAGITPSTLSDSMKRPNGPTKETIQKICDSVDMSIAEFFSRMDSPETGSKDNADSINSILELLNSVSFDCPERGIILELCSTCDQKDIMKFFGFIKGLHAGRSNE